MSPENRALAEKIIGHTFKNPDLLLESLTHSSIADNRLQSNERMEFLGDAVLDLIVCEALYRKFPEYMEGDLTKIKSAVVSRKTCAEVSIETGLIDLLIIGKGIANRAMIPHSLAAAVYESITAAVYMDGGFEVAKVFVLRTMSPKIDQVASNSHHQNYKAVLQQHVQKNFACAPQYHLMDEKGPDHSKCFEVAVMFAGNQYQSAWGPNKKLAEQRAALNALEALGIVDATEASSLHQSLQVSAATHSPAQTPTPAHHADHQPDDSQIASVPNEQYDTSDRPTHRVINNGSGSAEDHDHIPYGHEQLAAEFEMIEPQKPAAPKQQSGKSKGKPNAASKGKKTRKPKAALSKIIKKPIAKAPDSIKQRKPAKPGKAKSKKKK